MNRISPIITNYLWQRSELCFWAGALVLLFFLPAGGSGASLCPFTWLGFAHCPGCGIGHAIHYALHFNFSRSFHYHLMGIPAVVIIFIRIKQLLYPTNKLHEAKPD